MPTDTRIHAEIHKVQNLSRFLRVSCTYLMVMLVLIVAFVFLAMLFFPNRMGYSYGAFKVPTGQLTPAIKIWALVLFVAVFAVLFSGLRHLRTLFANFRAGHIYTSENVGHIRHLGYLALVFAFWQLVQPIVDAALLMAGVFDKSMAVPGTAAQQLAEGGLTLQVQGGIKTLPPFIMAGLVILSSWIMEMGRRTTEEAEHLRNEAELVV